MGRTWYIRVLRARRYAKTLSGRGNLVGQSSTRCKRLALLTGPCADAAGELALHEIGVAFRCRRSNHGALDTHLTVKSVPMHHARCARKLRQLAALAGFVVRVEDGVAARIDMSTQHDPRRRPMIRAHARQDHRVGIRLHRTRARFREPMDHGLHRIGRQRVGQELIGHGRFTGKEMQVDSSAPARWGLRLLTVGVSR